MFENNSVNYSKIFEIFSITLCLDSFGNFAGKFTSSNLTLS